MRDAPVLLRAHAEAVEAFLPVAVGSLCGLEQAPLGTGEAVLYALDGRGKRLRPALVIESCLACGGTVEEALPAAAAVELVHTFSLVHDDLPAMDDDDLRRGRSTVHKQFDEAAAVLAGDALCVMAFEVLAAGYLKSPKVAVAAVAALARATGVCGMIGGQSLDIAGEHRQMTLDELQQTHALKTGALLSCASRLGGIVSRADAGKVEALAAFGRELGLAFQIADDLLDVEATAEHAGKATRKDASAGKNTYPKLVGVDEARRLADAASTSAIGHLGDFGEAADGLRCLARFAAERDR